MSVTAVRLACLAFLLILGAARFYYGLSAKARPSDEVSPPTDWSKCIPAYVTSSLWVAYVSGCIVWPNIMMEPYEIPFHWLGTPLLQWIGIVLMSIGLWLFWYSHRVIGHFWSIHVELKSSHELITDGPYRYIRNPLYTSFFLGYLGTMLALNSWPLAVLAPFFVWSYVIFAKEEEDMLAPAFGEAYEAYKRRTGMFFFRLIK